MSNHKVACFIVCGAAAVTLAGYSAYAQRTNRLLLAEQATSDYAQPQISNRAAKTSRIETALSQKPVFALASLQPDIVFGRPADPVIASALQIANAAPMLSAAPEAKPESTAEAQPQPKHEPKPAAIAVTLPAEKAAEKPKHLLPPPPAAPAQSVHNGSLDDTQISGLKGRLRLTSDQVGYWPAVEAALRDVVRTQLRGKHTVNAKADIDVNSPEVQRLIWAAMPLLMRLRDDQKTEVRKLARVIGLDQVASQI